MDKIHLVLYCNIRNHELLNEIAIPYTYIGKVNSISELSDIYTQGDIVLSTSLYETLPGTVMEGKASGGVPSTIGHGGHNDIRNNNRAGYIADYNDALSSFNGIEWAINASLDKQMLHDSVEQKFSTESIAKKYIT